MVDENWLVKGIMAVSDVHTESGTFLSADQLQDMYRLHSLNFHFYLRTKICSGPTAINKLLLT